MSSHVDITGSAGAGGRGAGPTWALHGVDLRKSFAGLQAVDGVDLQVEPGTIVGLIGPNGAGKSTLFDLIAGVRAPDSGHVHIGSREVTGGPPHVVAAAGTARTHQNPRILTRMTVRDNMLLAGRQPGESLVRWSLARRATRRIEASLWQRADELLARVGLQHHAEDYAGTLSGGQRKLLSLARALMPTPSLLLLDEPMAGVNPTLRRDLADMIVELRAELGLTVLLIEHDLATVMRVSDTVVVMNQGQIIAQGLPEQVRDDPAVVAAYLGRSSHGG